MIALWQLSRPVQSAVLELSTPVGQDFRLCAAYLGYRIGKVR
jgi:hypothetical protein